MIDIDIILLILKVGILILLYLFIWRVVRAAVGDVRRNAAVSTPAAEALFAAPATVTPGRRPSAGGIVRAVPEAPPAAERAVDDAVRRRGAGDAMAHGPRLVVEASSAAVAGRAFPLYGPVIIGRDPGGDIVLSETVVSGRHARLAPLDGGYVVEDLGSTNGTFVNDQRVTQARLTHGSRLRIGDTVFRYEE